MKLDKMFVTSLVTDIVKVGVCIKSNFKKTSIYILLFLQRWIIIWNYESFKVKFNS